MKKNEDGTYSKQTKETSIFNIISSSSVYQSQLTDAINVHSPRNYPPNNIKIASLKKATNIPTTSYETPIHRQYFLTFTLGR